MNQENNQVPEFNDEEMHMPNNGFKTMETEHHGKLGLILGLLILALVLILAGLYLWYTNAFEQATSPIQQAEPIREVPEMPNDPETANADATVQQLDTVSPSNDLDSIVADVESTNLETLDAELNAIDAELGIETDTQTDSEDTSEPTESAEPVATTEVTDFESCVEVTGIVMESYPRQCAHEGTTYVEEIEEPTEEEVIE